MTASQSNLYIQAKWMSVNHTQTAGTKLIVWNHSQKSCVRILPLNEL